MKSSSNTTASSSSNAVKSSRNGTGSNKSPLNGTNKNPFHAPSIPVNGTSKSPLNGTNKESPINGKRMSELGAGNEGGKEMISFKLLKEKLDSHFSELSPALLARPKDMQPSVSLLPLTGSIPCPRPRGMSLADVATVWPLPRTMAISRKSTGACRWASRSTRCSRTDPRPCRWPLPGDIQTWFNYCCCMVLILPLKMALVSILCIGISNIHPFSNYPGLWSGETSNASI